MACTACLACLINTVSGSCKKGQNPLEDGVLIAGTKQKLSNLYSLDIYGTVIFAQLTCPLNDVICCLLWEKVTYPQTYPVLKWFYFCANLTFLRGKGDISSSTYFDQKPLVQKTFGQQIFSQQTFAKGHLSERHLSERHLSERHFGWKIFWLTDIWQRDIWPTDIWLKDIWKRDIWPTDIWLT